MSEIDPEGGAAVARDTARRALEPAARRRRLDVCAPVDRRHRTRDVVGAAGPWAEIAWRPPAETPRSAEACSPPRSRTASSSGCCPSCSCRAGLASIADLVGETSSGVLSDAGLTGYIATSVSTAAENSRRARALGLAGGSSSSRTRRTRSCARRRGPRSPGDAGADRRRTLLEPPSSSSGGSWGSRSPHRRPLGNSCPARAAHGPAGRSRGLRAAACVVSRAVLVVAAACRGTGGPTSSPARSSSASVTAIGLFNSLVLFPWIARRKRPTACSASPRAPVQLLPHR